MFSFALYKGRRPVEIDLFLLIVFILFSLLWHRKININYFSVVRLIIWLSSVSHSGLNSFPVALVHSLQSTMYCNSSVLWVVIIDFHSDRRKFLAAGRNTFGCRSKNSEIPSLIDLGSTLNNSF